MRRYRRDRISGFCFTLSAAVTLLCCSITWFPFVQEIAPAYLSVLNNHLFVFLLMNALVFVIYHLSNARVAAITTGQNDSASHQLLYDQYVSISSSRWKTIADEEKQLVVFSPASAEAVQPDENIFHNKRTGRSENADCAPVEKNPDRDPAVTETYKADRENKNFRRTRSQKYSVEKIKGSDHRRQLRPSETDRGTPAAVEAVQPDENIFHNKQIVHSDNADCAPVEKNPVRDPAVTETYKADREKKNFRRTRTQKYSSEKIKRSEQRRELRRSETENGREMVVAGGRTLTSKSEQEMSNEEFRLRIESFIASHYNERGL
ncbi:uncharacterized protein LOC110658622 [Hevea brasiliensis]|nr:uncharacterized protein LOC110658622 [Hevea brasiliensis]